jgi:uncharacterized protein (TIGR02266 family)
VARDKQNRVVAFLERTGAPLVGPREPTPARVLLGAAAREDLQPSRPPPPDLKVEVSSGAGHDGREPRRPFTARVELRSAIAGLNETARTGNLSSGGVFIETTTLLDVGDSLVLTFPTLEGGGLRVHGRVRWTTPFGTLKDPRPGMGIEFIGLDETKRRRLAALLSAREGAQA